MNRRKLLALAVAAALGSLGGSLASAETVNINPSKDNTLYEYDPKEGITATALVFIYSPGRTGMGEIRRGVLAFDIAGSIPPGSAITAVSLSHEYVQDADEQRLCYGIAQAACRLG